ncbi:caspase-3-like [Branchiostoma floridae x Branchiostoma japonicum]
MSAASSVWSNHSAAALQRVRVAFHDALKIMTSQPRSTSNSWLFALLHLDTFDARRRKLTHSFATRLLASENDIVRALACSDAISTSTFWSNYCKVVHRPRARRDAMVEEENIHLKNQVESEKGEVARLKDQITHFTTKNMSTYSISRKPLGIAVIINNIHFEDMADRGGAEGDTGRLQEAFESLGFTVMTFSDLDHSKMVATIKDQAKADHSNYDCFACCIMSHGTTGKVFSSDDVGLDICDLMKLFNANKCPSLKGKPKLFFIQACQGRKTQGKESIEGDLDATPNDDVPLNVICHDADFFLGLAAVPGYVTKRGKDGAPYVHHLAEMLKVYGPTHNLSAIMAMVCDKMNEINDDKFGWISSNHSTLRKEVIFNTE